MYFKKRQKKRKLGKLFTLQRSHNIDNQSVKHYFNFIFKGYQYSILIQTKNNKYI